MITFKRLQTNPWGSPELLDSILRKAVTLSNIDDTTAFPIFKQLNQPFSMYRLENKRLVVLYVLSEKLGTEHIIEALKSLESNVPWKGAYSKVEPEPTPLNSTYSLSKQKENGNSFATGTIKQMVWHTVTMNEQSTLIFSNQDKSGNSFSTLMLATCRTEFLGLYLPGRFHRQFPYLRIWENGFYKIISHLINS